MGCGVQAMLMFGVVSFEEKLVQNLFSGLAKIFCLAELVGVFKEAIPPTPSPLFFANIDAFLRQYWSL